MWHTLHVQRQIDQRKKDTEQAYNERWEERNRLKNIAITLLNHKPVGKKRLRCKLGLHSWEETGFRYHDRTDRLCRLPINAGCGDMYDLEICNQPGCFAYRFMNYCGSWGQ